MIVSDINLISYLIIPGDHTEIAERVRNRDADWIAPPLWISEFRNVLFKYIVAGNLSLERALGHMDVAEQLMRGRMYASSSAEVLSLAASSGCTAYDCEYVALAKSSGTSLLTFDKELLRKFPETAVDPRNFS